MNKFYKKINDLSEKAKKIDRDAIKVSVTVAVLFVSVWLIYLYYISTTSGQYKSVMGEFIKAQTEKESEYISESVSDAYDVILYMSASASRMKEEDVGFNMPRALTNAMKAGEFDVIVYADLEGGVRFPDGSFSKSYDLSEFTDRCDATSGIQIFKNENKLLTDEEGLMYIVPIVRGGSLRGYILGTIAYSKIIRASELRKELVHDEMILDGQGNIVCMIEMDNSILIPDSKHSFFEEAKTNMIYEDFIALATDYNECMSTKVPGQTIKNIGGEDILFIYYPIEKSDGWSVMNCYPRSIIETRTKKTEMLAIIVFALVVAIMIISAIQIVKYLVGEKKKINELEYLDGLTGIFNRNAFVVRAEEVLKDNKNLPYYMICFDIANFRIINEAYGHERSDVIIKELAKACSSAFGHNECYGRLTADVFVALTLDDGEENERIKYLEDHVIKKAREVYINHPIKIKRGRYEITDIKESVNRMIDKANIARKYISGNDFVCKYSEDILVDARKVEEIESHMDEALANGEFKPFLQAKFNMIENHISGAEALVRWIKPDGKVVPPGDFIPVFERNGFVEKIDFYMLEEICKYLRRMIDENREVYKISVNQSRYLLNDPDYANKVKTILLKYQIPVGLIELELTETVFFHEKERMIQTMKELKNMNVDLSIDDFGSGYSSFNILKDVPFDVLKIDREFLSDSVHTEKGKIILQKIVDMAHGLGMSVICEGVENVEQIELLVSIDCHYAQGFYYARPIPIEEFIEKYNVKKDE